MEDILQNKLNIIKTKYKDDINNYKYIHNINELSINDNIWYIKKSTLMKKTGIIKSIIDNSIIELINQQKNKIWYIYCNQYIFFKKEHNNNNNNKLKNILQTLLDTDFQDMKTHTNKKSHKIITYKNPCKIIIEKIQ